MQILLLGEQIEQLNRIKRRLWLEGVVVEIFIVGNWLNPIVLEKILNSKLTLIYLNGKFIEEYKNFENYKNKIILVGDDLNKFDNTFKEFFKYTFLEPIDYFNLSFLIKTELFNLQKLNVPKEVSFKNIVLNLENRNLKSGDRSYFLRNKEFALMRFFLENPGRLLTRMSILENVWDINADLFTNTVDVHVSRLRKLLKMLDAESAYIKTIPCSGYVFE